MDKFGFLFKRGAKTFCSSIYAKDFDEVKSLLSVKCFEIGKIVAETAWDEVSEAVNNSKTEFTGIKELDMMLEEKDLSTLSSVLEFPERKEMPLETFATKNDIENLDQLYFKAEFKALEEDDKYYHFEGLASTFGNEDLGGDVVMAGAFMESLLERTPKLLNQHDFNQPLGIIDEATETPQGLFIKGRMPKGNPRVEDVASMVKIGAIDSFSIGYRVKEFLKDADTGVRKLIKVALFEVSFVTFPMNPAAKVTGMKGLSVDRVKEIKTKRDFENILRESGVFSKDACVMLASKFREPDQSESDEENGSGEELTNHE